jgi:hypothetical protein
MIGMAPADVEGGALVTPADGQGTADKVATAHVLDAGDLAKQRVDVVVIEIDGPPGAVTLVRPGGFSLTYPDGIGGVVPEVVFDAMLEPVAGGQQQHQHEYAPAHAEARQAGSQLVAAQHVEHLSQGVEGHFAS